MATSVCIIIPPSRFLIDERAFINIGALSVASSLEQANVPVQVLDLSGVPDMFQDLGIFVAEHPETEWYGISATTPQMPEVFRLARELRRIRPGCRLMIGGSHATLIHTAWKRDPQGRTEQAMEALLDAFDVIISGDGERAIHEALALPANQTGKGQIVDANHRSSPLFLRASELDSFALPARHLLDMHSYHYTIDGEPATSLVAQRGCPFACRFCGGRHSAMMRGIRARDMDSVIAEVEHLHTAYGYKGFMFYDDELNVNPDFEVLLDKLHALQQRLGVEFKFRGFVKAELLTDRQAEGMYKAGFRWLLPGFESGSPRMLTNMNKTATLEDNTRCAIIAKRNGLKLKALMCVGHPGESAETIQETVDWVREIRPDDFDMTIVTVYPGTEYHDAAVRHPDTPDLWIYTAPETGDRLYNKSVNYLDDSNFFKGKSRDDYKAYVYTDHLSTEELVVVRDRADRTLRVDLGIASPLDIAMQEAEHSMGMTPNIRP